MAIDSFYQRSLVNPGASQFIPLYFHRFKVMNPKIFSVLLIIEIKDQIPICVDLTIPLIAFTLRGESLEELSVCGAFSGGTLSKVKVL